jgi:carboxypeptidase PM20D1
LFGEFFFGSNNLYVSIAFLILSIDILKFLDEEIGGKGAQQGLSWVRNRNITFEMVLDEGGSIVTGALKGVESPVACMFLFFYFSSLYLKKLFLFIFLFFVGFLIFVVVGISEKGYMSINLTTETRGGHSSQVKFFFLCIS